MATRGLEQWKKRKERFIAANDAAMVQRSSLRGPTVRTSEREEKVGPLRSE